MQVLDGEDLPDAVPRREALEEASTAVDADSEPEPLPARSRLPREDMERPLATFLSEMEKYGAAMRNVLFICNLNTKPIRSRMRRLCMWQRMPVCPEW